MDSPFYDRAIMGAGFRVRDELSQFFFWLREFETRVGGVDGGARWYTSSALQARVHYSWFEPAVAGVPALCLADLQFLGTANGQGFIEALPNWFSSEHHALEAEVLVIEHPSATLCRWLALSAFEPLRAPGEVAHSWYLRRSPARVGPVAVKRPDEALLGIWLGREQETVEAGSAKDAYEEEETPLASKATSVGSSREAVLTALRNSKGPADGFIVAKAAKVSPLQATRAMEKLVAEGLLVKKDALDGFNDPSATFEARPAA